MKVVNTIEYWRGQTTEYLENTLRWWSTIRNSYPALDIRRAIIQEVLRERGK